MRLIHLFIILANIAVIIEIADVDYIYKALYHNFAKIDNHHIFPSRVVAKGEPQEIPIHGSYNSVEIPTQLQKTLDSIETIAFLVIQDDSVKLEHYWDDGAIDSRTNSFSMAKTVVSILTGIAIQEGYIKSINEPVANYIPSFNDGKRDKITFYHLLTMTSGLDWTESYLLPISHTTEAYYGTDLPKLVDKLGVKAEPGTQFLYKSGDSQVLALALTKAIGRSISEYASQKLWKPMGATHDAHWLTDVEGEEGMEKAYCCLISNARDFSRLGSLYLNDGNWKGTQIVPKDYVKQSIVGHGLPDFEKDGKPTDTYGFGWWLLEYNDEVIYFCKGILGQYVISVPSKNMVIVKLGRIRSQREKMAFTAVYDVLDFAFKAY